MNIYSKISLRFLFVFLFVFILQLQNYKAQDNTQVNFASLYNYSNVSLNTKCRVYNKSLSKAILYLEQDVSQLHFQSTPDSQVAKLVVRITIRDNTTNALVDTVSQFYNIDIESVDRSFSSQIEFNVDYGRQYNIMVLVIDAYSKTYKRIFLNLDKTDLANKDNFILYNNKLSVSKIAFDNSVTNSDKVSLKSDLNENTNIKVEVYQPDSTVALSPYIPYEFEYDSISPDTVLNFSINDEIIFDKKGYFLIKTSQPSNNTLVVRNFGNNYPEIKTIDDLLMPMVYLCSYKEMQKLKNANDKKMAVDQMWYKFAGNKDKAIKLIKLYYNRVQDANILFSNYKQGWQTDMGMVYIIMGKPSIVNRSVNGERWIYGAKDKQSNIIFEFKLENTNYLNEYILLRDESYSNLWTNIIALWRKGYSY